VSDRVTEHFRLFNQAVRSHIGRSGWNTLRVGGAIGDDELIEAVDASYAMVVSKLPKKDRPAQVLSGPGLIRPGSYPAPGIR